MFLDVRRTLDVRFELFAGGTTEVCDIARVAVGLSVLVYQLLTGSAKIKARYL